LDGESGPGNGEWVGLLFYRPDGAGRGPGGRTHAAGRAAQFASHSAAEDNRVNQTVALRLLKKAGHTVELANNGAEAIAWLERAKFDCILMDVQMPGIDGLAATRLIRASGNRIPIVALTANAMLGDRDACLAAGMDGYIVKPFEMVAIESELRACVPV
jgi:CheY-like chemotaxis protein